MASPSISAYRYQALSAPNSTRVIDILPAKQRDDVLQIEIKEILLPLEEDGKRPTPYEALSYVWGARKAHCEVYCREQTIRITPSCETALRYLRRTKERRTLWIDALCIDQGNVSERSQQVQNMGDIYRLATRVIIWLGVGSNLTAPAFRYFRNMTERKLPSAVHMGLYRLAARAQRYASRARDTSKVSQLSGDSVRYLRELLDNSYFHRIWTVQEVGVANDAVVVCGEVVVPWEAFAAGASEFVGSEPGFTVYQGGADRFMQTNVRARFFRDHYRCSRWKHLALLPVEEQEDMIEEDGDPRLHQIRALLSTAHSHEASEPKDRVFGLYQLFRDLNIQLPPPVYDPHETVESVYAAATKAIVQDTESLDILNNIVTRGREPSLPSWAQEFRYELQYTYTQLWSASRDSKLNLLNLEGSLYPELKVDGLCIGYVSVRGATLPVGERSSPPLPSASEYYPNPRWLAILACCRTWLQIVVQSTEDLYNPTGEKRFEAFFRLLTYALAGLDEGGLERRKSYEFWCSTVEEVKTNPVSKDEIDLLVKFNKAPSRWWDNDLDIMLFLKSVDKDRTTDLIEFFSAVWEFCYERCFFLADTGHFGLGDDNLQSDDTIVIFAGASMPMILRPSGSAWKLIGPAIIHGVMEGQLWPIAKDSQPALLTSFTLI